MSSVERPRPVGGELHISLQETMMVHDSTILANSILQFHHEDLVPLIDLGAEEISNDSDQDCVNPRAMLSFFGMP